MPGFLHLLRCVGKAAVKHAVRALAGLVPMGREVYDMARDALDDYRGQKQEAELRAELQALAQVNPAEARQTAAQVTQEVAGDQPAEVQRALTTYLSQVPVAVRQSLRRPADPSGTTLPAGLSLKRPEDLLPFLPARLPRFQPGDCPPGVGDWQLVELLGTGGFGEVWKAQHLTLASRKPVALKFCLDAAAAAALRNEAQLLDRVMQQGRHPGIVPLLQTYLRADPPCLEYEYVEGGDLAALMQEQMTKGAASPEFATKIILHIAKTIAFAHRLNPPIVHRDLKPANILVQRNADGKVTLRVADFGIGGIAAAQVIRQEIGRPQSREQSLPSAVRGAYTPLYASPQQRRGDPPDPRDDIHALGVMWYQFLTGDLTAERPGGRGWRKKLENRGMAPGLIDLLESCIDDDSNERPADATELTTRIEQLLEPAMLILTLLIEEQQGEDQDAIEPHLREVKENVRPSSRSVPPSAIETCPICGRRCGLGGEARYYCERCGFFADCPTCGELCLEFDGRPFCSRCGIKESCTTCGNPCESVGDGMISCSQCGLQEGCPTCGKPLPPKDKYRPECCTRCGKPFWKLLGIRVLGGLALLLGAFGLGRYLVMSMPEPPVWLELPALLLLCIPAVVIFLSPIGATLFVVQLIRVRRRWNKRFLPPRT